MSFSTPPTCYLFFSSPFAFFDIIVVLGLYIRPVGNWSIICFAYPAFSPSLYIVIAYVKEISYKLNSTTTKGIPIPYKPFIKTDGEVININEEDMEEAMLYLADVEEYLKSKGWL